MSDLNNPAAPAARARPSSVTTSSYLLFLVAAIQVFTLISLLAVMGTFTEVYDNAYADTEMAEAGSTMVAISLVGGTIISLLVAAGLVVLALLNNRGKNPARIVTWVLGGIFLCCSGFGLVANAVGGAMMGSPTSTDPNVPDSAEVQRMLEEAMPGWYTPVTTLLGVVSFVALLVALILLALPPSNEFFRKPQAAWEPPVPGASYPAGPSDPPSAGPSGPPPA